MNTWSPFLHPFIKILLSAGQLEFYKPEIITAITDSFHKSKYS
jgi:hypothetical protein